MRLRFQAIPVRRSSCCSVAIGRVLCVLGFLALAACSTRGTLQLIEGPPPPDAVEISVLAATNLMISQEGRPIQARSDTLSFHRLGVVLPPSRPIGQVTWAGGGSLDPSRHITASEFTRLEDKTQFVADLRQRLDRQSSGVREAALFVHGFNSNFSEASARIAQLSFDLDIPAVPVLFAWPSQARALGYVHDRDSVLMSRAPLLEVLRLMREAGAERILLTAHSMGAQLVVEALLQADLAEPGSAVRLVDSVVLISPDISVDVFVSQAAQFRALPSPFLVFTSAEDRALRLSERVSGQAARLGKPSDDPRLKDFGVVFLDVTAFNDPTVNDFGHLTVGSSPALIALVPQLREIAVSLGSGASSKPGLLTDVLLTVRNATETTLAYGAGALAAAN